LEDPRVREHLAEKEIAKVVIVPGRLVSVVAR
jgi:leucyl-tRNA synthetase